MEVNDFRFKRNSIGFRLLIIGTLVLLLLIPSAWISSLVNEREGRKKEAVFEITSKWAQSQTIGGPVITVPYLKKWQDEKGKTQTAFSYIHFLPNKLVIQGNLTPEIRYRGIHKAILYNSKISLNGDFSFAKLDSLNLLPENVQWNDAFLTVHIPDMRGIKDSVELIWSKQSFLFEPGIRDGGIFESGISAKIPLLKEVPNQGLFDFLIKIDLNGSEEFNLVPLGRSTMVSLNSKWPNPSFIGAFLPEERQIDDTGFSASWKVLDLNRNYPQQWVGNSYNSNILQSKFGVSLFSPVDHYTKTTRATKYVIMFIGLTFLVFFMIEVFNKKRIHPIQYLLIGLSLCIFYLLLLSLSEHVGFDIAYLIAGISTIALISTYVKSSLDGLSTGLITAGLLTTLYTYLYILIQNQDYALLMGSIGLFIIMAIVMYWSRKVNWYKIELGE